MAKLGKAGIPHHPSNRTEQVSGNSINEVKSHLEVKKVRSGYDLTFFTSKYDLTSFILFPETCSVRLHKVPNILRFTWNSK